MAVLGLLPKQAPYQNNLERKRPEFGNENRDELKSAIEKTPGADNVKLSVKKEALNTR